MHRFPRLCSNESPLLLPENKERLLPYQTDKQKENWIMSPVLIRFETDGLPRVIAGTIDRKRLPGFFTPRGRAGLDVFRRLLQGSPRGNSLGWVRAEFSSLNPCLRSHSDKLPKERKKLELTFAGNVVVNIED